MTFWTRLPGEVPGNILCLSGTFCHCPHFSIPSFFLMFSPRDSLILSHLLLTPHSISFLLLLGSPPIYISCTLSLLFLQLFYRNDSLGLLNVWVYSVHLPQPSLTSALWIPPLAPQGSSILGGLQLQRQAIALPPSFSPGKQVRLKSSNLLRFMRRGGY